MGVTFFLHQSPGQLHKWSWTYDNQMMEGDFTNVMQINRAMFFMEEAMNLPHDEMAMRPLSNSDGVVFAAQALIGYGDGTVPDLPGWPWDLFREGPLKPTAEHRLHAAIDAIARVPLDPAFPVERLRSFHELVEAGEIDVALEDLAENIHEFEIPVPDSARSELLDIAEMVGLDKRYLELLAGAG